MRYTEERDRIALLDSVGTELAFITFPFFEADKVEVTHTVVNSSLRGQGIAGKLTEKLVDKLRREGVKAELTCSYALRWFAAHPECADVLIDPEAEYKKAEEAGMGACRIPRHNKPQD